MQRSSILTMRYLIRLFLIVFIISALSSLFLTPKSPNNREEDIALSVNGRQFLKERIDNEQSKYGYHNNELSSIYNSLITEEVLIQEAQRLGIDKEEEFRLALKNYYEQSLVKILLDRKTREIQNQVAVSDADIDNYQEKIGSTITFTRFDKSGSKQEEKSTSTVPFDDLAESLKILISTLRPGEQGDGFDTGSDSFIIRLDNVAPAQKGGTQDYSRKEIEEILHEAVIQQKMNRWLSELIGKADITIHNQKEKH